MKKYEHILVAIDLSEEADEILIRAQDIAKANQSRLTLVHVIEPVSITYGSDIPLNLTFLQEEIMTQAKDRIASLAKKIAISEQAQHIVYGSPEKEIHRISNEDNVDLIVVGSHGRHGWSLLFGSTSTCVLHGAPCDVLAVRVGK